MYDSHDGGMSKGTRIRCGSAVLSLGPQASNAQGIADKGTRLRALDIGKQCGLSVTGQTWLDPDQGWHSALEWARQLKDPFYVVDSSALHYARNAAITSG
ncbi:hypothetical protein U1Q18_042881 [Sarracenia purpurea var. burkii]